MRAAGDGKPSQDAGPTFAGCQLTVADIALYGYTHVADRCDYDLATFPAIRAWLRRVEQTPGFTRLDWQPGHGHHCAKASRRTPERHLADPDKESVYKYR
jgi:hypothetical protein